MKKLYTTLTILIFTIAIQAQSFDFSIVFAGVNSGTNNYQFALVATPSATVSTGNTADMVAGFYIPSGLGIGNFATGNSGIPAGEWSANFMLNNANGDGYFLARTPSGANVLIPGDGPFELVLFDLIASPNPTAGALDIIDNSDSIWIDSFSFTQNYINIDTGDANGTIDHYLQNDPLASSINFSTLGIEDNTLKDITFKAFPIPSYDIVTINNPTTNELHYSVKNMVGQDMGIQGALGSNGNTQIRLGQLEAAVYFIMISDGNSKKTLKIIIK
ncbi:hypothetical protein A9Q87_10215 [Flavobacteriales bacterium 34_180_T64]|nr:hypothetical protein A9Q87_10215 [Flavobacteriales bacterium 34_180_T64]